jgi:hypothetical protein
MILNTSSVGVGKSGRPHVESRICLIEYGNVPAPLPRLIDPKRAHLQGSERS